MLKSLELIGFKSFTKKTVFPFESRVTAIVGPNGSGKSNVVEGLRFVLGEQSIKSLRGKSGADLIFQGSQILAKQNRASVTIIFDNKDKIFKFPAGGRPELNLDFDEISISREIYSDGRSQYRVGGSEVRLKDILEILSSVNIGSSGHQIISQGEADRLLNASPRERKEMVEDALGLKIYQYRLRESERKIEKTNENIKEVGVLRREIAPELNFLKKQVDKIQKSELLRTELLSFYEEYLKKEALYIERIREQQIKERHELEQKLEAIQKSLSLVALKIKLPEQKENLEIKEFDLKIRQLIASKEEILRQLGRLEGLLEFQNQKELSSFRGLGGPEIKLPQTELTNWLNGLTRELDLILEINDSNHIWNITHKIKDLVYNFKEKYLAIQSEKEEVKKLDLIKTLRQNRDLILAEIKKIELEEKNLKDQRQEIIKATESSKEEQRESELKNYELTIDKNNLISALDFLKIKEENLLKIDNDFKEEIKEGSVLIGGAILKYQNFETNFEENRVPQEDRKRQIQKIKIKLEDISLSSSSEITKEFEALKERDQFLGHELVDLDKSILALESLQNELKEKLAQEFSLGLEKINKEFQEFFRLMFGGGVAFLSLLEIKKPKDKDMDNDKDIDNDMDIDMDNDKDTDKNTDNEKGILINVSLPKKKVKELQALSGGERSLVSIALLFAMSQVNPPPFLVLDETDAALDEANSKKYGDMVQKLSQFSQLILVTHNRETMSRAGTLYGVAIGHDGASRILSVKLEEAVAIAK